ncbi:MULTISPECIES: Hint domain-containing protein [Asaia]|uniref:Hint domain-containing protein n=1 Tax=Asaia TaxID=91914 RepID=UPI002FC364A4
MAQKGVIQTDDTITVTDAYDTVYVQASFLQAGGTLNVENASHVLIINDLGASPAYLTAGQINIQGNAYVESQVIMASNSVSVNFSGDYSILQYAAGQFTSGLTAYPTVSGFNETSKIMMSDFPAGTYRIGLTGASGGSAATRLEFYSNVSPGASLSIPFGTTITSNYATAPHGEPNGTASFAVTQCFLAGSLIETVLGSVAVEDLRIGSQVRVFGDQQDTSRMVIWTGRRTILSAEEGYPVRIKKDAFAPNEPSADLLITGEHCLCIDNAFVPVRMLVNGQSIVLDTQTPSYEVFHIELARHSIIRANNLLCESYLDTGTKENFTSVSGSDSLVALHIPQEKTWGNDSALPLRTERAFVEPIYRGLCDRAQALGMAAEMPVVAATEEAGIHLVTDKGEKIFSDRISDKHHIFILPPEISFVDLVTRTGKPSEMIGPFVDDRRALGVLVGDVTHFCATEAHQLRAHLTQETASGWHTIENDRTRWTAGSARIALNDADTSDSSTLSIEIVSTSLYPAESDMTAADCRAAA